jgi:hypothetical protein
MLLKECYQIDAPPKFLERPLARIPKLRRTIDTFSDEEIPVFFQFRSKEQLHRLMRGFHIPEVIRIPVTGNVFFREEFLLVSLYRLHRPTALSDGCFRTIYAVRVGLATSWLPGRKEKKEQQVGHSERSNKLVTSLGR